MNVVNVSIIVQKSVNCVDSQFLIVVNVASRRRTVPESAVSERWQKPGCCTHSLISGRQSWRPSRPVSRPQRSTLHRWMGVHTHTHTHTHMHTHTANTSLIYDELLECEGGKKRQIRMQKRSCGVGFQF